MQGFLKRNSHILTELQSLKKWLLSCKMAFGPVHVPNIVDWHPTGTSSLGSWDHVDMMSTRKHDASSLRRFDNGVWNNSKMCKIFSHVSKMFTKFYFCGDTQLGCMFTEIKF